MTSMHPSPELKLPTMVVTSDPNAAARILMSRAKEILAFAECVMPSGPTDLQSVLSSFPITDKAFYTEHRANAFLDNARSVLLFAETSGTSGSAPLLTPRGRTDLTWNTYNQSLAYRRHVSAGQDRVMLLNPSVMSPFIEGSAKALYDLGVAHMRVFPIPKICDWSRIGRLINDYAITAIMSTPTLILKMLFELERLEIKVPSLNKFLLTGEHLSRSLLSTLDAILGVAGASRPLIYGSSESASVFYGLEGGDYAGFNSDFVFEILPIEADWQDTILEGLPDNAKFGRLAVSWLRDGIMTLVRFDTNDLFSCWQDPDTDRHVFRSHGRANIAGLSPVKIEQIEQVVWAGQGTLSNVFHFDLSISRKDAVLNIVTRPGNAAIKVSTLEERLNSVIGKPTRVLLNPEGHSFFDASPSAKTNRFLFA